MTDIGFKDQIKRLRTRFGDKNFDAEFIQLVWTEVHDMSEHAFKRFVDVLIGSRTANKPPLLSEFREARQNEQKLKFDNDVRGAAQALRRAPEEMRKHLRQVLKADFGGVTSLTDAMEVARIQQRAAKANDSGPEGAA